MRDRCKNNFYIILSLIAVIVLCSACARGGAGGKVDTEEQKKPVEIMVFAAASLTESFTELKNQFEAENNIKVTLNFAGSQTLATSIDQGAKVDVFASANLKYMEDLKQKGLVEQGDVFAKNQLVICKSKGSKAVIKNLKDLGNSDVKLVVGDMTVPVGKYFYTALDDAFKDQSVSEQQKQAILKNIKSQELNVKDIVSKVLLGTADAGVVYRTDINESNKNQLEIVETKEFEKSEAQYPIDVITASNNAKAAHAFVDFILSNEGKEILNRYGFLTDF